MLYPCHTRPTAIFDGAPGFSLERWVFWAKPLDQIRATWTIDSIGPGLRSVPEYASDARQAMESAELKAVSFMLEKS